MGMFPKSLRRGIASLALGLWIFALSVSIAHACGVPDALNHVELPAPSTVPAGHAGDESSPACDQFCADAFPALPKLKVLEDGPASQTAFAAIPGVLYAAADSSRAEPPPRGIAPPPALAINTRFVRLAL